MSIISLQQLLIRHEGYRKKAYLDMRGKVTIGVGRNLDNKGLDDDEIMTLLRNDIQDAEEIASQYVWYQNLDDTRKDVVLSLIFNLGKTGFETFVKFLNALRREDYEAAAHEMEFSLWANQVGDRAKELSYMMRTGNYINLNTGLEGT